MYLELASMAKYQSVNSSTVTIFTNGPPSEDPVIQKGLEASKALGLLIEQRKIRRLEPAGDVGVNVVLEGGEKGHMGFLVHQPVTTLVAEDLVTGLRIEKDQSQMAKAIKRNEPFGTTNVNGVFAVGDAGTSLTVVVNAMAQDNI
jgi:thioredoxin reductase